jgi:Site-specific recombinases, DNA invertase Pin homologs
MTQAAIIYARFSTSEQSKGHSLERQAQYGLEYAQQQGWAVEATIKDEGKSAFKGGNRAEGSALATFETEASQGVHHGKVLIVENIDRLSRQGAKTTAQLIWALNKAGVDVATWQDNQIYRADGNGDMLELFSIIIKAQLAYDESKKKSDRTAANWKKRHEMIASGDYSLAKSRPPLWLNVVDNEFEVIPDKAALINRMFDMFIDGFGYQRIAKQFNDEGIEAFKTTKSNTNGWYGLTIDRFLRNRAVIGEYVTSEGETLATDFYPLIVPVDKFNRAQAIMSSRVRRSTGGSLETRSRNLFGGIATCHKCNGHMGYEGKYSEKKHRRKDGGISIYKQQPQQYLRCDNARRKHLCDNTFSYRYGEMEKTILDHILHFTLDDDEQPNEHLNKIKEAHAELGRQIAVDEQKRDNLLDAISNGGGAAFITKVNELEEGIKAAQERLGQLKQDIAQEEAKPRKTDDQEALRLMIGKLNSEDMDERIYARTKTNTLLRQIVDGLILMENGEFALWIDSEVTYHWDKDGNMLSGQML